MLNKSDLLKKLLKDSINFSELYHPGPYWKRKNNQAYLEIIKKGVKNFRGADNNIGHSFSDNQNVNILNDYNGGSRGLMKIVFQNIFPFKNIFIRQVSLSSYFRKQLNYFKFHYYKNNQYSKELVKNFSFENTTDFGCEDFTVIGNNKISNYYLEIADVHSNIAKKIDFNSAKTFFEIGGGFGANIHFILQNYKNIKKIIYLDLPINLYVATNYLKRFYGNKVKDYLLNHEKKIVFENNNDLEIYCIPPWKIEDIENNFDIFQNSSSFVEMPLNIVQNYLSFIKKYKKSSSKIALTSYKSFDKNKTLDPEKLKDFFDTDFFQFSAPTISGDKENIYFLSK